MRKTLLMVVIVIAAFVGTAALATKANAAKSCRKGEHPVHRDYGTICCRANDPVCCSWY